MNYEVDVCCPRCVELIRLTSKESKQSHMASMGNADFVGITCPECDFEFYISETDYDKMRKEREE